jgi:hypothetical protein
MILTDPNPIETLLAELSDGALRGFILRRGDLKK